mgnify:FL=1
MKMDGVEAFETGATLADVRAWAVAVGEPRDAVYELEKVAPRLGHLDEELDLVPADLAHFESVVAPAPYGAVAPRARNVEAARRRGNSRLRALLKRYHDAQGDAAARRDDGVRATYDEAIARIVAREGFTERGAALPTGTHRPFFVLRARCRVPLAALDQAEVDRITAEATPEARKRIRNALKLIARLRAGHESWPEIAELLPCSALVMPAAPDRARRILWTDLPAAFREDAERVVCRALGARDDLAAVARAELAAGRTAAEIDAMIADMARQRSRTPQNREAALAGYRQALTWLLRERPDAGAGWPGLTQVRQLFDAELLQAACEAQIARTAQAARRSSTLWSRLTNLTTLARYGLADAEAVSAVSLMRTLYHAHLATPKALTDEADRFCTKLRDTPHLAAAFVNAPARLAEDAEAAIAAARAAGDRAAEDQALRLHAAAVLFAVQLSRPLRMGNLFGIRVRDTGDHARNLSWRTEGRHAEIRFAAGEVKNGVAVRMHVVGADAALLWRWVTEHRPRLVELRGLGASPYLLPGTARPRFAGSARPMPPGCLSPASQLELWAQGERRLGLGLTPHQCRHAVATLMLALEPGNFARVAAVLGDTEDTVRRHYGKDSGEAAAAAVRAALQARHPDIWKKLKRTQCPE